MNGRADGDDVKRSTRLRIFGAAAQPEYVANIIEFPTGVEHRLRRIDGENFIEVWRDRSCDFSGTTAEIESALTALNQFQEPIVECGRIRRAMHVAARHVEFAECCAIGQVEREGRRLAFRRAANTHTF